MTPRNLACRSRFIETARTRTVAECLASVAAHTRIPLINNHLDRHLASPNATHTLFLIYPDRKSPMAALSVNHKRRCNSTPWGWLVLPLNVLSADLQIADLIKFNRLKTRISNRQRIPRHLITNSELVFGVSTFPYADEKFSGLTSDITAYP